MSDTSRCWHRCLLFLMVLLIALAGLGYWTFKNMGGWLVVADPLKHARAIVVLSGQLPYRAMGAADLYHQGWASEVWITTGYEPDIDDTFARLGIPYTHEWEYNRQLLEKQGVPAQAIRVLPTPIRNTADEVGVVAATLRRAGEDCVIIMTSPLHTRRVRTIWHIQVGDHPQVIVRYNSYEEHEAARWWRTTSEGDDVVHEVLGLLNARLRFVAKPKGN